MKAVIFNSGIGKRMGKFTQNNHKSMAVLNNGETIFERQIRILRECGITEFIVTTGPFKEQLLEVSLNFPDLTFHFVDNPIYDKTNYIYSMFLAANYLDNDVLLMHGDLVFNKELVQKMLEDSRDAICLINEQKKLPEKDFKGRIQNGLLKEVSINIFDEDCYAFQPLYKLSKEILEKWVAKIGEFVANGKVSVYAENALNTLLNDIKIYSMSYSEDYIDEIDNLEDYTRVKSEIELFENKQNRCNKYVI